MGFWEEFLDILFSDGEKGVEEKVIDKRNVIKNVDCEIGVGKILIVKYAYSGLDWSGHIIFCGVRDGRAVIDVLLDMDHQCTLYLERGQSFDVFSTATLHVVDFNRNIIKLKGILKNQYEFAKLY